ncbi:hypothetical protein EJ05DRAFT_259868 [Pseudovirgaria hyperparasitica]|uniref:Uncharacterized protein n=1 Tax=Pseudovirgaria hyperparasitica TaxID=470096 RepID=A0A6A6WF34_9PEZI|nr:uncharacterized protein EJ05DRAFT_259868 [Pseudovirgaria hyperparasitica]KAF2761333.1 hypothetical protein EJ05DRAFT_259868 [Pseudovirgaria hyperparasitica]
MSRYRIMTRFIWRCQYGTCTSCCPARSLALVIGRVMERSLGLFGTRLKSEQHGSLAVLAASGTNSNPIRQGADGFTLAPVHCTL